MSLWSCQRSQAEERKLRLLAASILGLSVVGLYWPILQHDFILLDDPEYVLDNPLVRDGLSLGGLVRAFEVGQAGNWHPLTWTSHMLDVELFGMSPGGHHAVSLLFHLLNTLLLFRLLERLLTIGITPASVAHRTRIGVSAGLAAFWALHPLRIESVAWVSERKDVLSAAFWLLTLQAYLTFGRRPNAARYALVMALLGLGLMAKPMLVSLPLIMLLLDYWPLRRRPKLSLLLEKLPLLLLALGAAWLTVLAQQSRGALAELGALPIGIRVANALVSYLSYLLELVWPGPRSVIYPLSSAAKLGPPLWLACLIIPGLTILAAVYWRRLPWLTVGWFWYVISLVPVIGLVTVGMQARADRYTYLPHVGLLITVSAPLAWLLFKRRRWRAPAALLGTLAVVLLAASSARQLSYWSNGVTLFRRALEVAGPSLIAHHALSLELLSRGAVDEATSQAALAVGMSPRFVPARLQLAGCLLQRGQLEPALEQLIESVRRSADGALHLGPIISDLLGDEQQRRRARELVERRITRHPRDPAAQGLLEILRREATD